MSDYFIQCRDLWKSFPDRPVLCGVDLAIEKGCTAVVIGQSGCGKSVLLKNIVGLLKPDRGEVYVDGEEITRVGREKLFRMRMRFGMVFQSSALFDSLTVGENVALALREHTNESEEQIGEITMEKLRLVGLEDAVNKKPAELSGGMRKRAGIARAIVMNPDCVLYDEPTTGLDPITADVINDLILKLKEELRITGVVVTHDIKSAYKVGDKIAMLHDGRIVFEGTPDEVEKSDNGLVRQFIAGQAHGPITMT